MPNYIYLDSKIVGAAYQIVQYFKMGVFSSYNTTIYFKKYKESFSNYSKIFQINHIHFKAFEKNSELNMQAGGVVFYLFNAQSNCRMVADRTLKHVFVTHGESNKVSSIKPIIRIYDYVITAGQMGINRYLNHKLFNIMDVEQGRLLMMGDTFVGENSYIYQGKADSILYAPTWEGGVPDENYSSLEWNNIFDKLLNYLHNLQIKKLIVQPHPNLGHRLPSYKNSLYAGIKKLLQHGIFVTLVKDRVEALDYYFSLNYKNSFKISNKQKCLEIREAFCDISAMEAQLYAKFIPVRVFIKSDSIDFDDDFLTHYYQQTAILKEMPITFYQDEFKQQFYDYIFGYTFPILSQKSLGERVSWLSDYVYEN
ncbi:MAG: hypothetical protein EOO99_11505 [Pedobacter sp.]|nr:MAG: hypothetical protein EOO99_11505 [Pedobacter sp.]